MAAYTEPEPGQKWVRFHTSYKILDVGGYVVTMQDGLTNTTVEETLERFHEEAEAGRAVHHPNCETCNLPVDPDDAPRESLHYGCWFQDATVQERCKADADRPGGNRMAAEALRADDPREHLLNVIGDPARTLHDRIDAENLLSGAVPTTELLDASIRCPNCMEGEAFEMNPSTGEVRCHCGQLLKEAD